MKRFGTSSFLKTIQEFTKLLIAFEIYLDQITTDINTLLLFWFILLL